MNMLEELEMMLAASAKKKQITPPDGWEYIGEVNGKPRFKYMKRDNFRVVVKRHHTPFTPLVHQHVVGGVCPHCNGVGRFYGNGKCFRCDGKGKLDEKDLAFYEKRKRTGRPICRRYAA